MSSAPLGHAPAGPLANGGLNCAALNRSVRRGGEVRQRLAACPAAEVVQEYLRDTLFVRVREAGASSPSSRPIRWLRANCTRSRSIAARLMLPSPPRARSSAAAAVPVPSACRVRIGARQADVGLPALAHAALDDAGADGIAHELAQP